MSKRISKQEIIAINEATEIIKARTAYIKEASRMMRELIASFDAMNEDLAARRIARRNGKSND